MSAMVLTIYGSARSRTLRTLWAAEELGLNYTHVPVEWDDPFLKTPEFLALNPAGAIPTIADDGFAMGESLAINLYLAKRYGSGGAEPLYLDHPYREAETWRWTLWAQGEIEPWVQADLRISVIRSASRETFDALIRRSLEDLERSLAASSWLAGDHFTIADLNVASVLSPSRRSLLAVEDFPQINDWLARCYDRPAARRTRARFAP